LFKLLQIPLAQNNQLFYLLILKLLQFSSIEQQPNVLPLPVKPEEVVIQNQILALVTGDYIFLNQSDGETTCDYNGMLNDDIDESGDKS
jgi:hypothetical protein